MSVGRCSTKNLRRRRSEISHAENETIQKHTKLIHGGLQLLPTLEYGMPGGFGNKRWTAELIFATYEQATTGKPPESLEDKVGDPGGGFDRLDYKSLHPASRLPDDECDLSIDLNRRG